MRREKLYLEDIVEAADAIATFLGGAAEATFVADDLTRSAVLLKLINIGEAAAKLPGALKERHADIPWADIIGFRNVAAHAYFGVRWPTVSVIAAEQIPKLRQRVAAIVEAEFPGDA